MTLNAPQMREELKKYYPFGPWGLKVDRMPDNQVYAVWQRLIGSKQR